MSICYFFPVMYKEDASKLETGLNAEEKLYTCIYR